MKQHKIHQNNNQTHI